MKKKRQFRKWTCLPALLMLLTLISSIGIFAQSTSEKDVIRVGYTDKGMMIKKDGDGVAGYGVDYLNLLAKYTGWEYEFVPIDEATRIDALKKDEVDLLCDVSEDEIERDTLLLSNDRSCMHYALICAKEDDTSVFYNEFSALDGKRIAVNRSRKMDRMMEDFARLHNISYQPVYCATIDQLEAALKEGRADLMVASNQRNLDGYKFVAKAGIRAQYFATSPKHTYLMDQLNKANDQLLIQQPFLVASLMKPGTDVRRRCW